MAAPGTFPVPFGRGRWRLSLHTRAYVTALTLNSLEIAEIFGARSIRLEQALNASTTLTFTVDGNSPEAQEVLELSTDVVAWRWDDQTGKDVPVFRGIVAQSQDTLSEQAYSVNFTCHDYLAMLERRILTAPLNYNNNDQDDIVQFLITYGVKQARTSSGANLTPGNYLSISPLNVDASGATRAKSGQMRQRNYAAQQSVGEAIENLGAVANGFDFDVAPAERAGNVGWGDDQLRIFYPYQGTLRTSIVLEYGSSVSALTRSVNSGDYANYWRIVGNNGSSDPAAAQLYAEAWNSDANNVTVAPQGLWMSGDNQSDVSILATLQETANGNLAISGSLLPSYSIALRPGWYAWGVPNMGDVVTLRIKRGRLNVNTQVRVVGITYDVGEDGQEDVTLALGSPAETFAQLLTKQTRDINALARR